jgi:hypothetical protein
MKVVVMDGWILWGLCVGARKKSWYLVIFLLLFLSCKKWFLSNDQKGELKN